MAIIADYKGTIGAYFNVNTFYGEQNGSLMTVYADSLCYLNQAAKEGNQPPIDKVRLKFYYETGPNIDPFKKSYGELKKNNELTNIQDV